MNSIKKKVMLFEPYGQGFYGNQRYINALLPRIERSSVWSICLCTPYESLLTERIRAQGIEVSVIEASATITEHGGNVLRRSTFDKFRTAWSLLLYGHRIAQTIRRDQISILQCHSVRAVCTVLWCAFRTRTPIIWYIKGELQNPILDAIGFVFSKRILFQTRLNARLKYKFLQRLFSSKIRILPNAIDLDEIAKASPIALPSKSDAIKICCVARIEPLKGIDHLIEAFILLRSKLNRREAQLYIVGGSDDRDRDFLNRLRERLSQAALTSEVHFLGFRSDVLNVLAACDLFVLPSLSEGLPKSMLEAIALGKPVVVTRVGGTPEVIEEGRNGFLVPPRDPYALCEKLRYLVEDDEKRNEMTARCVEQAQREFSLDLHTERLLSVYNELA